MTLSKEYSIAADSTLSSSPPTMTPPAKVKHTYGRRREPHPVPEPGDPDSSYALSLSSSSASRYSSTSSSSIYRTGPPDVDEEIPPSSDAARTSDDEGGGDDAHADDEDDRDASPKFQFSWKKQLKEMDELDDDEDMSIPNAAPPGDPSSPRQHTKSIGTETAPPSPRGVGAFSLSDSDVFGSSSTTLAGSFSQPEHQPQSSVKSPSLSPERTLLQSPAVGHRAPRRAPVVHGSDSDGDLREDDTSPGATSPACPHPITTPKLRSSPTPPTSDADMERDSDASSALLKKTGKGKAKRGVPPLKFDDELSKTVSGKSQKRPNAKSKTKTKIKVGPIAPLHFLANMNPFYP